MPNPEKQPFCNPWHTQEYARGTSITMTQPWGVYVTAKAMCSDGKVRKVSRIAQTADSFDSVPASVRVNGKHIAGFITVETEKGFTVDMPDDPAIVKFYAYSYLKNGMVLPEGAWTRES